jgi:hypothetical protein
VNLLENKLNSNTRQQNMERYLEIVNNVCEITYIKFCEDHSHYILEDNDDDEMDIYDIEEVIIFNSRM